MLAGDGVIQKDEFRRHVLEMGIVAEEIAIDKLFQTIDIDGSGELELNELEMLPKKLNELFAGTESSVVAAVDDSMQ
jgi:Ca2+-binding EF-hand superfamily protein